MRAPALEDAAAPLVPLIADHPGFRDPAYRRRRDAIARPARDHRPGTPAQRIKYTPDEERVWSEVWRRLRPLHEHHACTAVLRQQARLRLDEGLIPQLEVLARSSSAATEFTMEPVPGLIEGRAFLAADKQQLAQLERAY